MLYIADVIWNPDSQCWIFLYSWQLW